jgi:uncharacterized membrane protein YecN with MAPEG domain
MNATNEVLTLQNRVVPTVRKRKKDNRTPYELFEWVVKSNGYAFQYIPTNLITPEMCLIAVSRCGSMLAYVPNKFITLDLCLRAVREDGRAVEYIPEEFITPEILITSIKTTGRDCDNIPTQYRSTEIRFMAVLINLQRLDVKHVSQLTRLMGLDYKNIDTDQKLDAILEKIAKIGNEYHW